MLKTFEKSLKDIDKKINYYDKLLYSDSILTAITRIFNGKVGDQLDPAKLKLIVKEGEERYRNKVPPGFMDGKKDDNKFGDLIIWKELIKKSKDEDQPFIFITNDSKEDWWTIINGKTIMPRPELSQELFLEANQVFYLYTTERFLEYASQSERISKGVIDEVRDTRLNPFTYNLSENQIKKMAALYDVGIFPKNDEKLLNHIQALKSLGSISPIVPNQDQLMALISNSPVYSSQADPLFQHTDPSDQDYFMTPIPAC